MTRVAYAVCTTPRSGGNYLDRLLREAGLGDPAEYLWLGLARRLMANWGVTEPDYLPALWDRRTVDGVFGVRAHWSQRDQSVLVADWDGMLPPTATHRWLHLVRASKEVQAYSYLTAWATGDWSSPAAANYIEHDRRRVALVAAWLERQDADWRAWHAAHGVDALVVSFEALVENPDGTVAQVRDYLTA